MMKALKMAMIIEDTLKYLQALKNLPLKLSKTEIALTKELSRIFRDLEQAGINELIKQLEEKYGGSLPRKKILALIEQRKEEIAKAIGDKGIEAASIARENLFKGSGISMSTFLDRDLDLLRQKAFVASEATLSTLKGDVIRALEKGVSEGLGTEETAKLVQRQFTQMSDSGARRISRTEVNSFQNEGAVLTEKEMGVQYHEWVAATDGRTRDNEIASHLDMNGEIVEVGKPFSNGLMFPGDKSGIIEEWINCRCRVAPFIVPVGMKFPEGQDYYRRGDLVPIPTKGEDNTVEVGKALKQDVDLNQIKAAQRELELLKRIYASERDYERFSIDLDEYKHVSREKLAPFYGELTGAEVSTVETYRNDRKITDELKTLIDKHKLPEPMKLNKVVSVESVLSLLKQIGVNDLPTREAKRIKEDIARGKITSKTIDNLKMMVGVVYQVDSWGIYSSSPNAGEDFIIEIFADDSTPAIILNKQEVILPEGIEFTIVGFKNLETSKGIGIQVLAGGLG